VAKRRAAVTPGKTLFYRQLETGIEAAYQDPIIARQELSAQFSSTSPG